MRTLTDHLTAIDGVSARIADALVTDFDTYAKLADATTEQLTAVKGVGPVLADRIHAATAEAIAATAAKDAGTTATKAARKVSKKVTSETRKASKAVSAVAARADAVADNAAARAASVADDVEDKAEELATDTLKGLAQFTDKAADGTELIAKNFAEHLNRREFGPVKLPSDLPKPVDTLFNLTEAYVTFSLGLTTGVLRKATSVLR